MRVDEVEVLMVLEKEPEDEVENVRECEEEREGDGEGEGLPVSETKFEEVASIEVDTELEMEGELVLVTVMVKVGVFEEVPTKDDEAATIMLSVGEIDGVGVVQVERVGVRETVWETVRDVERVRERVPVEHGVWVKDLVRETVTVDVEVGHLVPEPDRLAVPVLQSVLNGEAVVVEVMHSVELTDTVEDKDGEYEELGELDGLTVLVPDAESE